MRPLSLLLLPQKSYPTDHAMLEEVYSKILPARGHRVTFVMQSREPLAQVEIREWNGARVHVTPNPAGGSVIARGRRSLARNRARFETVRIARRLKPDIVQVRNEVGGALVAAHLQFWHHIPFVYQISFPVIEGTAAAARLGLARFRPLQLARAAALVRLQRRLMSNARLVLPISEVMKADLVAAGVPPDRMLVFPLGADVSREPDSFDPAPIRARLGLGEAPVVLYFGALDRLRQLDFLVEAFAPVAVARPDARLVLLGRAANPDDIEHLRRRVRERALSDRVVFAGGVPRAEVPAYLATATVSVSPYPPLDIYRSVSPTKLMEAMAAACPVVGNDVSEQGQILRESGGGLTVAYEPAAFAGAITALLDDPDRAREMGRAGRRWAVANRGYEALASQIEAAYYRLLGETPAPDDGADVRPSHSS